MAHLLVSRETVIDQENSAEARSSRGPGKHKRSPKIVLSNPLSSASKRRALAPITNQPLTTRERQPAKPKQAPTPPPLDSLFLQNPSFFCGPDILTMAPLHPQPIGQEVNLSTCANASSNSSASFSISTSFRSFGSPGSSSPMMLSSPNPLASSSTLVCTEVIDIDLLEDNNCAVCGEYAGDIFAYLKEAEVRFHPKPGYMAKQPDITNGMRAILVDWLVEVVQEFKLEPQTFYLSMSIVDRFLSCMSVLRSKLQLVGTASIYIAAKFEEIYPPEIADFVYITDDTYTKSQIVRMERLILQTLNFNLVAPTTDTFLQRFLRAAEAEQLHTRAGGAEMLTQTIATLAKYLCELAVQDIDPYLKYLPSVIAASAICLARHTLEQVAWPPTLQHYSGYSVSDIGHCVQDLHRTFAMAQRHPQQAIRQKYSTERYMKVSSLKAPETLPC